MADECHVQSPRDAGLSEVQDRLRRVHGQLAAVISMIEQGRGRQDVVMTLSAASKELDRAGFAFIVVNLHSCLAGSGDGCAGTDVPTIEELEALFLSLA